jgi:hypothetical protein
MLSLWVSSTFFDNWILSKETGCFHVFILFFLLDFYFLLARFKFLVNFSGFLLRFFCSLLRSHRFSKSTSFRKLDCQTVFSLRITSFHKCYFLFVFKNSFVIWKLFLQLIELPEINFPLNFSLRWNGQRNEFSIEKQIARAIINKDKKK